MVFIHCNSVFGHCKSAFCHKSKETGKKNVPDKAYLIKDRAPILMLHVIQAEYNSLCSPDLPNFLYALGVGFPKSADDTETANYKVNLIELKNWIEIPDNSDDE